MVSPASWRNARRRGSLGNALLLVTDLATAVGGTSRYVLMCLAAIYADHPEYQEGWIIDGGP
ncbi:hypothetical protein [Arthrobacter sp. ZGTC131]|uniref:hypothetical protein n=1 Tax=Arthrobacter sp. ZGTC131 TaxID=2058898 RepID=UPI000CE2C67E|nr:hypothetical protein [Arthrobacter sp. ZGTC131]